MSGAKLDGAGVAKLQTLQDAAAIVQRIHGIVEEMALAERNGTPLGPHVQRFKRAATPLVGLLKGQFGTISDAASSMILTATRGSSDRHRIRGLRENIGSLRIHLELAEKRVRDQHTREE